MWYKDRSKKIMETLRSVTDTLEDLNKNGDEYYAKFKLDGSVELRKYEI